MSQIVGPVEKGIKESGEKHTPRKKQTNNREAPVKRREYEVIRYGSHPKPETPTDESAQRKYESDAPRESIET